MGALTIDAEAVWELYDGRPGDQVDPEYGGWRLELTERLRDDDWYSHWRIIVSREDEYFSRNYYRLKFRRGLTEPVHANENYPTEMTLTQVYPVTRMVAMTEYVTNPEAVFA